MMKSVALVCVAASCALLGGCRVLHNAGACHKRQDYQSATSVPPLKIPQGLDSPDTAGALKLPVLNEPTPPPRTSKDPCLDEPPPFKVNKPAPPPQA